MLLKGEALIQSFTFDFAIHGQRNEWTISITAPGHVVSEAETQDATPYLLFNDMLADAYEAAVRRRFPQRAG